MNSRRNFLGAAGALLTAATVSRAAQGGVPEAPMQNNADTQPPLTPPGGRPYNPVITLNGWTLPWRMNNGWKEFHLVAEPVRRQIAPGMTAISAGCGYRTKAISRRWCGCFHRRSKAGR